MIEVLKNTFAVEDATPLVHSAKERLQIAPSLHKPTNNQQNYSEP